MEVKLLPLFKRFLYLTGHINELYLESCDITTAQKERESMHIIKEND